MRSRWALAAILIVGAGFRIALLTTSLGTPDALFWSQHVQTMERTGVLGAYAADPSVNHPPLGLAAAHASGQMARVAGLQFIDVFRALQTLADVATALLLFRLGGTPAAAYFFLSPAAIFISGFHCQSDPLMVVFLVLAVVATVQRRPALAGTAIACAGGIKIIALVAVPLLALAYRRRSLALFGGAFVAVLAALFVPATMASGSAVWHNVFAYTGQLSAWGSLLLFGRAARPFLIVLMLLSLALLWGGEWLRRQRLADEPLRIVRVVGVAICAVLFFAPGFGVQYLFWPLPFLALMVDRRLALAAHGVVGAWLFAVYTAWSGGWPWWFGNQRASLPLIRAGLTVWLMLGLVALLALRELWRRRAYSSSSSPSTPALLYFLVLL